MLDIPKNLLSNSTDLPLEILKNDLSILLSTGTKSIGNKMYNRPKINIISQNYQPD